MDFQTRRHRDSFVGRFKGGTIVGYRQGDCGGAGQTYVNVLHDLFRLLCPYTGITVFKFLVPGYPGCVHTFIYIEHTRIWLKIS